MSVHDLLEEDCAAAYEDENGGQEIWRIESGTGFTALFQQFDKDHTTELYGDGDIVAGEIRWQSAEMATVDPDTHLYRQFDGRTWQVKGKPADDGFGEIVAVLERFERNRIGGR